MACFGIFVFQKIAIFSLRSQNLEKNIKYKKVYTCFYIGWKLLFWKLMQVRKIHLKNKFSKNPRGFAGNYWY